MYREILKSKALFTDRNNKETIWWQKLSGRVDQRLHMHEA